MVFGFKKSKIEEKGMKYIHGEEFYITDQYGNIGLKVNSSGATSFNFITPQTDLNGLATRTGDLENAIATIHSTSLVNLQNQAAELQTQATYIKEIANEKGKVLGFQKIPKNFSLLSQVFITWLFSFQKII